jgi:hypothetical protein
MGVTREIAPTPEAAMEASIRKANKIACGPLSIKATLTSAHQVTDPAERADALSELDTQYSALPHARLHRRPESRGGGAAAILSGKVNRVLHRRRESPPIESRAAMISGGTCNDAALRFSRRCPREDVPGIGRMLGER